MKKIFIINGLRTPVGALGRSLKGVPADDLAAVVIEELVRRSGVASNTVDEVILGNAVGAGLGQNPARQASINAGLPSEVPAFTVDMVCGSGLKSVMLGAQAIRCTDADVVIAGGMESVSGCPYFFLRGKKLKDLRSEDIHDSLIEDGLWCSFSDTHMVEIAEYTAKEFNVSRQEQDEYALESHRKATGALGKGAFESEIVPVTTVDGHVFKIDEKPRKNISMERMTRLPAVSKNGNTITAGNSPAPADAAAAVLLASEAAVKNTGIMPLARVLGYAEVAVDPKMVFTAAGEAIKKCLRSVSLEVDDIDLFEINESFAVQILLTIKELGINTERLNVSGGAIALGHPLGASGPRALVTLINALKRRNEKTGITAICLGGGCAVALAVRMI